MRKLLKSGEGNPPPDPCFSRKGEFLWHADAAVHGGGDTVTGQGNTVTNQCGAAPQALSRPPSPTHRQVPRL